VVSQQGLDVADKVLEAVRAGLVGQGDSVDILLAAVETLHRSLSTAGSREEAVSLLRDSTSYLPAGSTYSGVTGTLALVLEDVAEEVSRDPRLAYLAPADIADCIYQGLHGYVREALAKIYDYCRSSHRGTTIVVPRGSLALTCAIAASHAGARVLLPYSRVDVGEEEARSAFDRVRGERVPWFFAYQMVGPEARIVSQAELVTPRWAIASRGTRELLLQYYASGGEDGFELLALLAGLAASAAMPEEYKLPIQRVRTPWQAEAEIPVLEITSLRGAEWWLDRVATEIGWAGISRQRLMSTRRSTIRMLREVVLRRCNR